MPSTAGATPASTMVGSRLPWSATSFAEASAGPVEGHPPVDADHVGARVADQLQQFAGGHPEVDAGHTACRRLAASTLEEWGST